MLHSKLFAIVHSETNQIVDITTQPGNSFFAVYEDAPYAQHVLDTWGWDDEDDSDNLVVRELTAKK